MIDEKDWEILGIMQRDGRATYGEIGQEVSLAASSVHERVRKLELKGVIKGFGPHLDAESLGLGLCAFVSLVTNESCSVLGERLRSWPEVEEYHSVAGEECSILKVRTANATELHELLERIRILPGVERTNTTIVLKTHFDHKEFRRPSASSVNGAHLPSQ